MATRKAMNPALQQQGDDDVSLKLARVFLNSKGQRESWIKGRTLDGRDIVISLVKIVAFATPTDTPDYSPDNLTGPFAGLPGYPAGSFLVYTEGGHVLTVSGADIETIMYGEPRPAA